MIGQMSSYDMAVMNTRADLYEEYLRLKTEAGEPVSPDPRFNLESDPLWQSAKFNLYSRRLDARLAAEEPA